MGTGFCALVLLSAISASAQNIGERCSKPSNRPGTCVSIRECPILLALLNRPNPNLNILHEARCGFSGRVPVVCCPDPVVPGGPSAPKPTPPIQSSSPTVQDVSNHRNVRLLPMDICGPVADERIIGGEETALFEYPWMALLGYLIRGTLQYQCGGSLVNEKYVLTAAHCVTNLRRDFILTSVRLGEHNLKEESDCDPETGECAPPPLDFDIEQSLPHPQYAKQGMKNDIALVRIRGRVDFSSSPVRPICLPVGSMHQNRNLDEETLIVAGWGVTENQTSSDVQLKVKVPVVPLSRCSVVYQKTVSIGPNQLCAGGEKGKDSCSGDSGGPLFFFGLVGEEQKTVQYGVVSFGPRACGTLNMPGVYTRVGHFMDWILNTMKA